MSKKISRREYLRKNLLLASSGLASYSVLSSCASLDSFFKLDQPYNENEVVIIGAGSAGLAAAHQLKKLKIPYRVFEASSRLGGRVLTLDSSFREGQNLELGADLFDLRHQVIFDLAKEYRLEVEEVENITSRDKVFFYKGKWIKQSQLAVLLKDYFKDWNTLKLKVFLDQDASTGVVGNPLLVSLDQWPLKEYFSSLRPRIEPELQNLLLNWIYIETGATPDRLSALQWILFWEQQNFPQSKHRIAGGNQKLLQFIYERVSGVIPDYLVRLNTPLAEINYVEGVFQLSFAAPSENIKIRAKYVILAIPPNQLSKIAGLRNLDLPQSKKMAMSELNLSKQQRFIFETKDLSSPTLDKEELFKGEKFFIKNSNLKLWSFEPANRLKSFNLNYVDINSEQQGSKVQEALIGDVSSFNRRFKAQWTGEMKSFDWATRPWIQGSRFQYEKNQFYLYRGLFSEPDYEGRLSFVGDYTHLTEWSHWAGALESGLNAAIKIAAVYHKV